MVNKIMLGRIFPIYQSLDIGKKLYSVKNYRVINDTSVIRL